eukprot:gene17239-18959_t
MAGMAFDGASSMKCLARLMKQTISQHAMYSHCFAYCNELVFKDATSLSPLVETSQDLCEDLYALVEEALTSIDKLYIRLQELRSDEEFQKLFTNVAGLTGAKSLDEARAVKRKRVTPRSTSNFVAYLQAPIESTDIGERNVLHANFDEAIDATSQTIKDRFDQEDLKNF